jgi:hypothetical protein
METWELLQISYNMTRKTYNQLNDLPLCGHYTFYSLLIDSLIFPHSSHAGIPNEQQINVKNPEY